MHNSVVCTEDIPYLEDVDWPQLEATYMGAEQLKALQLICARWPAGYLASTICVNRCAVDVPALLLSGSEDPITPPRYGDCGRCTSAQRAASDRSGTGSRRVHPRLPAPPDLGIHRTADVSLLDGGCVERLDAVPFFLDLLGPAP